MCRCIPYLGMQEHVILDSDALGEQDPVTSLEWCPSGRELHLMAITAGSKLLFWRHGAAAGPVLTPLSIRDWQLDHVRQLSSFPGRRFCLRHTSCGRCARHMQTPGEKMCLLVLSPTTAALQYSHYSTRP